MATTQRDRRQRLRRLVDELPESELSTAVRVLEALHAAGDPFLRKLLAAPEGPEASPWEERAIASAEEDIRAGRFLRHVDLKRQLEQEP